MSEQGMPRGADVRGVFQGGLFMLALLAALYAAREIVLPIVLAIILDLLLQPALRLLERLHLPRMLGALLLIALLFGTIVARDHYALLARRFTLNRVLVKSTAHC